ncbi:arsenate reductase ArsC [Desulfoferrobacter suflitae]|uniref:arsenate reductase ArsC n=1 Tax=Desulfoferrobacter suflitae TaxID=2865782 RepID=UPI00216491F8|nr:arsenate reductase ArsC [Desulfoferrobacter suflitae]MCK8604268.1 arsenate reductase ArsC [Desulfoferrobacter suflitae]
MRKKRILFICRHNNGRSQIAEAYLKKFAGEELEVESGGFEPAEKVNPLVVEVMKEEGIDLSDKKPQKVFQLFKESNLYDHVITVCEESEGECPVFPGITKRWSCPFPDPAAVEGAPEERIAKVREIRDMIKNWLLYPAEGTFSFKALIEK